MKKKKTFYIFWALLFAGIFLILCQVGYSDGDDAFFYKYTHQMGFWEYLSWRYETWVGRMAAEALVYVTFRSGIWFWRIVNAAMLVLLPAGVLYLAKTAAGAAEYNASAMLLAPGGYLLMSVMTVGYAAIWVNGSIFYTWSFTCGVYALFPIAELIYKEDEKQPPWQVVFYSVLLCIFAVMSIEQMGAVLLSLEVIGAIWLLIKRRKVPFYIWIQIAVTAISFAVLFLAPGNAHRVAAETLNWMPQFDTLTVGEHLFFVVLWLLSSFANENCLFLCALWLVCTLLLAEKKAHPAWIFAGGIFIFSGLLSFANVPLFSDLGLRIGDITVCLERVPKAEDLTGLHWFAFLWWIAALLFTFLYLWKAAGFCLTNLLVYPAAIASEAIMYFSPTIFASGARVYYLTDILLLFLILTLSMRIKSKKLQNLFYGIVLLLGGINVLMQIPVILEKF